MFGHEIFGYPVYDDGELGTAGRSSTPGHKYI
jgi:hypothetical protein